MAADYYTPGEILETYPRLKDHGWNTKFIGELLCKNLLDGKVQRGHRSNLINIHSLHRLVEFQNQIVQGKKIQLT